MRRKSWKTLKNAFGGQSMRFTRGYSSYNVIFFKFCQLRRFLALYQTSLLLRMWPVHNAHRVENPKNSLKITHGGQTVHSTGLAVQIREVYHCNHWSGKFRVLNRQNSTRETLKFSEFYPFPTIFGVFRFFHTGKIPNCVVGKVLATWFSFEKFWIYYFWHGKSSESMLWGLVKVLNFSEFLSFRVHCRLNCLESIRF